MTAMIRQLQERGLSTDDDRLVEAARYRYLRDTADPAWVGKLVGLPASTVDAAIDAAIRKDG